MTTSHKQNTFSSLMLPSHILEVVAELGYQEMTPIQSEAIPALLAGRDLIAQAKTGSGKTAAYALPILARIQHQQRRVQALVLCPTRELCAQVAREIRKMGRKLPGLQVLVLSGGMPGRPQSEALAKGVHIVVGTPGRVSDHIGRDRLNLSALQSVVLDEADRMLDMGFEEEMAKIFEGLPKKRQTSFFSATYPESVDHLSKTFQREPLHIRIQESEDSKSFIRQMWIRADLKDRRDLLIKLIEKENPISILVFCNFKLAAQELAESLQGLGIQAGSIHGDLEQYDRNLVLARFRNHSLRVLIATDVAARGLDIEACDWVVNFELPHKPEVYVHRIGRTGRAGKSGKALSFVGKREVEKLAGIEEFTRTGVEEISEKDFASAAAKQNLSQENEAILFVPMETLYIAAGRKQKMRAGDILGALTGEAGGLKASDVGKIEIHDNFSYVAIRQDIANAAVDRLLTGQIKGRQILVKLIQKS